MLGALIFYTYLYLPIWKILFVSLAPVNIISTRKRAFYAKTWMRSTGNGTEPHFLLGAFMISPPKQIQVQCQQVDADPGAVWAEVSQAQT